MRVVVVLAGSRADAYARVRVHWYVPVRSRVSVCVRAGCRVALARVCERASGAGACASGRTAGANCARVRVRRHAAAHVCGRAGSRVHVCLRACVGGCAYARVRVHGCASGCVRVQVRACVRAVVVACARERVRGCVCSRVLRVTVGTLVRVRAGAWFCGCARARVRACSWAGPAPGPGRLLDRGGS